MKELILLKTLFKVTNKMQKKDMKKLISVSTIKKIRTKTKITKKRNVTKITKKRKKKKI
jgi:hypothetical protein